MKDKLLYLIGVIAMLILARDINVIARLPQEAQQGAIFKIIFFHVPVAITAMIAAAVALIASVLFLITGISAMTRWRSPSPKWASPFWPPT